MPDQIPAHGQGFPSQVPSQVIHQLCYLDTSNFVSLVVSSTFLCSQRTLGSDLRVFFRHLKNKYLSVSIELKQNFIALTKIAFFNQCINLSCLTKALAETILNQIRLSRTLPTKIIPWK